MSIDYLRAKGVLRVDERQWLHDAALAVPAYGAILNIGIEYGASMACLRSGNMDVVLIGVDIDISKVELGLLRVLDETPTIIYQMSSKTLLDKKPIRDLDLIFIDGDHGELGVQLDLGWAQYVKVDGIMAFHDCYDFDLGHPHPSFLNSGVDMAINKWLCTPEAQQWVELPSVGSMRIFRKRKVD